MLSRQGVHGLDKVYTGKHLLMMLCLLASVCGCSTPWFPTVLKVDEAAVREVRKVGDVVAETRTELVYESTTQINPMLIVDLGEDTFSKTLSSAQENLAREGWVLVKRTHVLRYMESPKWEKTVLSMSPLELLEPYHAEFDPKIAKAIRDHKSGDVVYLLVELSKIK